MKLIWLRLLIICILCALLAWGVAGIIQYFLPDN